MFGIEQALGTQPVDWDGADGESSFLAVPFLPLDEVVVLHQVRHPLQFARSMLGTELLADHRRDKPFPTAIGRHAPEVYEPARPPERAAVMWRNWNTRAEAHADLTYRLEDLDESLLLQIATLIDLDLSEEQAAGALASVPKDVNRRQRIEGLKWARIEPIVGELAAHYGYEPAA